MVDTYTGMLFSFQIKEILQYVVTWMNLEDSTLCGKNQSQKDKCCIILFI